MAQIASVLKAQGPEKFAKSIKLVKDGVERELSSFTEAYVEQIILQGDPYLVSVSATQHARFCEILSGNTKNCGRNTNGLPTPPRYNSAKKCIRYFACILF
jgi:hypothetical protein